MTRVCVGAPPGAETATTGGAVPESGAREAGSAPLAGSIPNALAAASRSREKPISR